MRFVAVAGLGGGTPQSRWRRAKPPRSGEALPAQELSTVRRDAERRGRSGTDETAPRPHERARRRRGRGRPEAELASQIDRPRLADDERIGARPRRRCRPGSPVRSLPARAPAASTSVTSVGGSPSAVRSQPVGGHQPGDARRRPRRPARTVHQRHRPAPPTRCSANHVGQHLDEPGSAFGIRVRAKRTPGLLRDLLRLDVEVVQDLQVVGDEARRAHHHAPGRPVPASSRMTSSTGGPSQGSAVRPALCHPVVYDAEPSRAATRSAVSRSSA